MDPNGEFAWFILAGAIIGGINGARTQGGFQGFLAGAIQGAVVSGFAGGLAGPVGSAVFEATGSATLSLIASSTVSSSVGSVVSGSGFSPRTDLGFGAIDWTDFSFKGAFSGNRLSDILDGWSIASSNFRDVLKYGQKFQYSRSKEAQRNLAHGDGLMTPANQNALDKTKYNVAGSKASPERDLKSGDIEKAFTNFLPEGGRAGNKRGHFADGIGRLLGVEPDFQNAGSGEHRYAFRLFGGDHYAYDKTAAGFIWRLHRDKFDVFALGGAGALGHWFYESVKPVVQLMEARMIYGYRSSY